MTNWISCKDRMPEPHKTVLLYQPEFRHSTLFLETISTGKYITDNKWYIYDDDSYVSYDITHWMPLPKPPNGQPVRAYYISADSAAEREEALMVSAYSFGHTNAFTFANTGLETCAFDFDGIYKDAGLEKLG